MSLLTQEIIIMWALTGASVAIMAFRLIMNVGKRRRFDIGDYCTMAAIVTLLLRSSVEAGVISHAITTAWDKQEDRWLAYEEGAGRSSPDRLPSWRPVEVKQEDVGYPDLPAVSEQKEEDRDLFVQQPPTPAPNAADLESTPGQVEKREPLKFNVESYLAQLRRAERWSTLTENEQASRAAIALANYDHCKAQRLKMDDIEEEKEEL
ncbi:uncharacterized protein N7498_008949 [Penicillium cinerascens]|uniref:Uncharacterized protein n=1 Tax=Penicillium cinerascens TaxID=70096 RepID=A0A9W9JJM8_9EURO|nr:uncharacterized protein N7498_008949 [Penicillium cinerascens]KAJ5195511.1 hypothetical protein N7498_008949 [Penicillium cinerascens]